MKSYPLSSVRNAIRRYPRRVFIAVGVEIGWRWRRRRKRRSIFPKGHYAAMGTASVPLMRREYVIFVGNLILGNPYQNNQIPCLPQAGSNINLFCH